MKQAFMVVLAGWLAACSSLPPSQPDAFVFDQGECFSSPDVAWFEGVAARPGELEWRWPAGPSSRFCLVGDGGLVCGLSPRCEDGVCSVTQRGLAANERVTATVQQAQGVCPWSRPSVASIAVVDATSAAAWSFVDDGCDAASGSVDGGVLALELRGASCKASLLSLDTQWGDGTWEAELRVLDAGADFAAGVALDGRRFLLRLETPDTLFPAELRQGAPEQVVARGLHGLGADWRRVRLVLREREVSWQEGAPDGGFDERLRWTDRTPAPAAFGLTASGSGRVELRNLRVSSLAGPLTSSMMEGVLTFDGEATLPSRARGLVRAACPALAGCDAGCVPPVGASCGVIGEDAGLGVGAPRGLDARRDWTVTLRFATDGGAAVLLPGTSLLEGDVARGQWHLASWRFPADGGQITTWLDGVALDGGSPWPLPGGIRSLDALELRGLVVHELRIR
ncbi:MAG: hypothetical protein ACOZQL_02535 [Myxococcota bacterium]